ncbi:transcriptional regulator family: HMG [Aspergillus niger]|nr:transcriptional regulator family: HMG [Aspergillus niger]KAI3015518.1 transcriptional regulator family: HMG [Aspergillus niger]
MSESSVATTKPTEIGTEASTSLQATPGDPMSEPPPPYFQAWFMPGTGCEELSQRLPCISDGLPQASGKLAVSFDQPVPVLEFAANDPYYLVPQPIHDNTQTHEDKLIPEEGSDADHTKPEALCRKTGLRKSSCFEAQTRDGQAKYAATRSQNPCLPCPLSELNDGMQDIPVRDMYAWVHRPVATRRQETRQRHQRIPRPLNSFILYRMAYNDRVKHWLGRNDHQTISRLSGQSWKMEAAHIREKYETLAEMEKQNHARAHPGYRFSLSSKRGKPRTAKGHSRELTLRSKAFSKLGQNSQPAAWAPSVQNNRACERSIGTFPAEEGTLIHSDSLNPDGSIPLGSAASVWEHWMSYSQTTSADHGSKGTQPSLPVATGQTEIPAIACFVPQPAAPGIDAANSRSALLPLSVPYVMYSFCEEWPIEGK